MDGEKTRARRREVPSGDSTAPLKPKPGLSGPPAAHGSYLLSGDNIIGVAFNPATAVTDTIMIRQDVYMNGEYTGRLYEKIGPVSVNTPALGTFAVNSDYSFTSTLRVPEFFSTANHFKRRLLQ